MPASRFLKSRWTWVTAMVVAITVWTFWYDRLAPVPEGYGTLFASYGYAGDELLDGVTSGVFDPDPAVPSPKRAKEESTPVDIDGRPGKRATGWYVNGQQEYEEHWLDDKQHGRECWWNGDGRKLVEQHWKEGYLHGRHARWYMNGQLAEEAYYDHYLLHGTHQTWYRNGQVSTVTDYRNGLREGNFTAWHSTGAKLCEATFSADRLHGVWQKWDANGKVVKRIEYRRGEVISEIPPKPKEPFGARDFAFIVGQGSGWHGYNTLRVSASGRCEFRYYFTSPRVAASGERYTSIVWRKVEFQLTEEIQAALEKTLKTVGFLGLQDQYVDPQLADGTQWVFRLRENGKVKEVFCSNKFPESLRQLSRTLRDRLMDPHHIEVLTASRLDEQRFDPGTCEWLE